MHKLTLKIFDLIKNFFQFIKIALIFLILVLILYWIKDLTVSYWSWTKYFAPILIPLLDLSQIFFDGSADVFNSTIEYKYIGAVLILLILFFITNLVIQFCDKLKEFYCEGRKFVKKIEEKIYNKKLELVQNKEQNAIKNYVIYIATTDKKQKNRTVNIDLTEQNKIMNKFLIEQTSILPEVFENGFLYKFSDFENIDKILDIFFKVLKSNAPIDYYISVHSYEKSFETEKENFKKLISLGLANKISMFSQTAYRYSFNKTQKYETVQHGIFQKNDSTFEILCFEEK